MPVTPRRPRKTYDYRCRLLAAAIRVSGAAPALDTP